MSASSGQRDCQVTIEGCVDAQGARSGYPTETWRPIYPDVWMSKKAELRSDRSAERIEADQVTARLYTTWLMPYRADMDPDRVDVPKLRRLVYLGRTYDIIHGNNEKRGVEIRLTTLASSRVVDPYA